MGNMITTNTIIKGDAKTHSVTIDGVQLDPARSRAVCTHSLDGYDWGYDGFCVSQLALALMLETTPDESTALKLYPDFKQEFLVPLSSDRDMVIDGAAIVEWLEHKPIVSCCAAVCPVERLIDAYGYWGEHPEYPLSDWQYDVSNGDTRRSYWEWVNGMLEQDIEA
jgi:hypothetical protein